MDHTADLVVVGAGPAGHAAAREAARRGARVLLVEMAPSWESTGVVRGELAIHSLRESALAVLRESGGRLSAARDEEVEISSLVADHNERAREQGARHLAELEAAGVSVLVGRARLSAPGRLDVTEPCGDRHRVTAERILWCSGARPHPPEDVPVDHENIMDTDSVLSLLYLPRSLMVLGGGPRAAVFATLFAGLGVQVTVLDPGEAPLPGLEREQNQSLLRAFERRGCRWIQRIERVSTAWDGLDVVVHLSDRRELRARKALAIGEFQPVLRGIRPAKLGLELDDRGFVRVDATGQTSVPGLFAAGGVTGLAGPSSEQARAGRQAAGFALAQPVEADSAPRSMLVAGLPALGSVGMGEAEVMAAHGGAIVGVAALDPLPGSGEGEQGRLKVVAHPETGALRGAHATGEGADAFVLALRDAVSAGMAPEHVDLSRLQPELRGPISRALTALQAERAHRAAHGPATLFGGALTG